MRSRIRSSSAAATRRSARARRTVGLLGVVVCVFHSALYGRGAGRFLVAEAGTTGTAGAMDAMPLTIGLMAKQPTNPNEVLFQEYLIKEGISYEYEPELPTPKDPDFALDIGGLEVVCEVEGFDRKVQRQPVRVPGQAYSVDPVKELSPIRHAYKRGVKQLKDLANTDRPLVVVIGNAEGADVDLTGDSLQLAIEGNPIFSIPIDTGTGGPAGPGVYAPRSGKGRDHLYVSAVVAVYFSPTQQGRPTEEFVPLIAKERIEGEQLGPCVDVLRLRDGRPAVPLPDGLFAGPFDRVWDFDGYISHQVR